MNLQTKIYLKKETKNSIDYNSKLILLGSCFSENIANKLTYFKFKIHQNPFGILFHPKAIENLIKNVINKKEYVAEDLIFQDECWHSFDAHSNLSSSNQKNLLKTLNSSVHVTNKKLKKATHVVITLGTSWIYRSLETGAVVANCHKIPQKKFSKELLSVVDINNSLETIISLLKSINKDINVLFTVSPIRHLKDGFIENTQSKSHLITAIHNIVDCKNIFYFPSYEIMMDELRDYRFYSEDMIHPNKIAINYIWEKFTETWFGENSKSIMKEVELIQKGMAHKPFSENSEKHQKFLQNLESKKEKIRIQFPFINF